MPTDRTFESDGVEIAYDDVGEGPPIVLVHGFASSRRGNWQEPGWYDALVEDGRRVIALDCRGHGDSGKPHDPAAYADGAMPGDVVALLDHLSIPEADLMGYSMGGRISLRILADHEERLDSVVLGGVGQGNLGGADARDAVADALVADDPDALDHPEGRRLREFAEGSGNDLAALAAVVRAFGPGFDPDQFADVSTPVLVVNGSDDRVGGPGHVADGIPGAEAVVVPDRDHLTTVSDQRYMDAVIEFLEDEGLPR